MDWFELALRRKLETPSETVGLIIVREPREREMVFRDGRSLFRKAYIAGIDCAMDKPVDPRELVLFLKRIIKSWEMTQNPQEVKTRAAKAAEWESTLKELFLEHTGQEYNRYE